MSNPQPDGSQSTKERNKARKPSKRVPHLKRLQIIAKSAAGMGPTEIAKQEGITRNTVARIVKSEDAQAFAEELKAQYRGLGESAIGVVRESLDKGNLSTAWRCLEDLGVVERPTQTVNQNVKVQKVEDVQESEVNKLTAGFARIAMERARVYNCPMPELEDAIKETGAKVTLDVDAKEE